ncbi:MAG: 4-alpha-glucanotransferase, partial [Leptolyngbya sp. ERB_1_2]
VPAGEETAINGEWIEAPGAEFFETLGERLGKLPILAEDLGIITPEVEALRDHFNFPGMKILQFAFGDDGSNTHLPHHYVQNSIVYPGTHDNDTAIGWWNTATPQEKEFYAQYIGYTPDPSNIHWVLVRMAFASVAVWAIPALQDILGLDGRSRMNDPSQNAGNWRWRYVSSDLLTDELAETLRSITTCYSRLKS